MIEFTGIEIQPEIGQRLEFEFDARKINLLELHGGESELILSQVPLVAGHYNWIRLKVNAEAGVSDSYIELENGLQYSLKIPSEDETGLKLVKGFDVPAGGTADFTIDFDLRKSIHNPAPESDGEYILRPTNVTSC